MRSGLLTHIPSTWTKLLTSSVELHLSLQMGDSPGNWASLALVFSTQNGYHMKTHVTTLTGEITQPI